jgi:hypothetical protein
MQEEQEKKGQQIGTRVFKLITGELVFGKCETVLNNAGATEILIKHPYTAYQGGIVQYCMPELAGSPAAIQIHPMNIVWQTFLNEFTEADKAYTEATTPKSNIITDLKRPIII